jgi:hypothetical protein
MAKAAVEKIKPFEKWETEEVELTFGIRRVDTLPLLTEWLNAEEPTDAYERETLQRNHRAFQRKASFWNEDEIKFFFISKVITLVDFNKEKVYSTFTQRTLTAQVTDIQGNTLDLRGRVELLVARGEQKPRQPFFFLNEYKPQFKTTQSDPVGQLLISMVATQSLNNPIRPMYGVYVVGQLWWFVLLEGKDYAISKPFDAADETTLFKIFSILKRCKTYIETAIAEVNP